MREGNLYDRIPIGGGGSGVKFARITVVASQGRRAYTARFITFSTDTAQTVLQVSGNGSKDIKVFNMLEANTGDPFLDVNDQVVLIKKIGSNAYLCEEFPRGYP